MKRTVLEDFQMAVRVEVFNLLNVGTIDIHHANAILKRLGLPEQPEPVRFKASTIKMFSAFAEYEVDVHVHPSGEEKAQERAAFEAGYVAAPQQQWSAPELADYDVMDVERIEKGTQG